ncbi:hypothetical protein D2962_06050 [Biomaibacter acetigenes]|uniref:DUF2508 family protein n=1 Tax=Biomaibacter acetigenes TaxID=2316383 RepID=A0A3G2R4D6_9FIRM|nr:hypothetical protein [Biomaibacter acetigenes]AYO30239.1 hypothetical protein D2962_06050 [Biomaibacter acetigenes]
MEKREIWQMIIDKAKLELTLAEQDLQNAESDFVVAAAYEVVAKREKLNALICRAKKECA